MKSKYIFYVLFLVAIHFEVSRLIGSVHPTEEPDDASYEEKGTQFESKELPSLSAHRYSPYTIRYYSVKKHGNRQHLKKHHQNKVY